ncbi:MAG: LacI family transcriptional regulator [Actinomycetia bacterium]|nr:LacI family transcriptional regulator [Actinomycetes bacterium]
MKNPDRPRRATIEDVAREAGVSVATVSRAIRGLPNVAVATRLRVRRAAEHLDYQADAIAARLASGHTMSIALIAPFFGEWHTSVTLAGIEDVLVESGYDLLITSSGSADAGPDFIGTARSLESRVDGLLTVDLYHNHEKDTVAGSLSLPVVTIGEHLAGHSSLTIPNTAASREATEHLISLGHRRIALMTSATRGGSPVPELRQQGYELAMTEAGLEIDSHLIVDGRFSIDGGREATDQLLGLAEPPTAVFCLSDLMAFGALQSCRQAGLRVPHDLSIVGFDDHEVAGSLGLTTMRQPVRDIGARAAQLLLERLGSADQAVYHEEARIGLVVRSSTARPNRG